MLRKKKLSAGEVWALGITIAIGGQYFWWNSGLVAGFGACLISTSLIGFAFLSMCMCSSEMSSAMPFSGGSYGYARCIHGYYLGFVVGYSEIVSFTIYVAFTVSAFASIIVDTNSQFYPHQPLIWFIFYLLIFGIHIWSWRVFRLLNFSLALFIIAILGIHFFGSLPRLDFAANVPSHYGWFLPDGDSAGVSFFRAFPLAMWMFLGLETPGIACDEIRDPRLQLPVGQLASAAVVLVSSWCVLFCVGLIRWDDDFMLSQSLSPLSQGLGVILGISPTFSVILTLPALFARVLGYVLPVSKIAEAMSKSCLLPAAMQYRIIPTGQPVLPLLLISLVGFALCLLMRYEPRYRSWLYFAALLHSNLCFLSNAAVYIIIKKRAPRLPKHYRSPWGIYGAYYSALVWIICSVSVIVFQKDNEMGLILFSGSIVVASLSYCLVIHTQKLSEQETVMISTPLLLSFAATRRSTEKSVEEAVVVDLEAPPFLADLVGLGSSENALNSKIGNLRQVAPVGGGTPRSKINDNARSIFGRTIGGKNSLQLASASMNASAAPVSRRVLTSAAVETVEKHRNSRGGSIRKETAAAVEDAGGDSGSKHLHSNDLLQKALDGSVGAAPRRGLLTRHSGRYAGVHPSIISAALMLREAKDKEGKSTSSPELEQANVSVMPNSFEVDNAASERAKSKDSSGSFLADPRDFVRERAVSPFISPDEAGDRVRPLRAPAKTPRGPGVRRGSSPALKTDERYVRKLSSMWEKEILEYEKSLQQQYLTSMRDSTSRFFRGQSPQEKEKRNSFAGFVGHDFITMFKPDWGKETLDTRDGVKETSS